MVTETLFLTSVPIEGNAKIASGFCDRWTGEDDMIL